MIRKNLKVLIIATVVTLLPIMAGVVLWDKLPEQIPIHWNASGDIDGWGSKTFGVFGIPLILAALEWVCAFVTFADPKKANHSGKVLQLVFWIIPVLSVAIQAMVFASAMGTTVRVEVVMPLLMGLMFVIIGNYMPKCRQNYTIGIKVPWTLHSEENWNRTHRLAGRIWVACGLVMMLAGFFGGVWVFFAAVVPMCAAPLVYSYILHRKGI